MKKLAFLLFFCFSISTSVFSQKNRPIKADGLSDDDNYIGFSNDLYYFSNGLRVKAIDELGKQKLEYDIRYFDFKDISVKEVEAVMWKGKVYIIAKTKYKSKEPTYYALMELKEEREATEATAIELASINFPRKSGSVPHDYNYGHKIEGGNFYFASLTVPTYRKKWPAHLTVSKVDANGSASVLNTDTFNVVGASGVSKFLFDKENVYFKLYYKESSSKIGVFNVKEGKLALNGYDFVDGADTQYLFKQLLHPQNNKLLHIGGVELKSGEKKLYIQQFNPGFVKEKEVLYSIEDLPSYSLGGKIYAGIEKSAFDHDVAYPDILNSMIIDNVFADKGTQQLIIVYHIRKSVSSSDFRGNYVGVSIGNEVVVASYDLNTLEEKWRTVINKKQVGTTKNDDFFNFKNSLFVGIQSFKHDNGVLIVYNDHFKNLRAKLVGSKLQEWNKAKESNIIGVYIDKNGKATKQIVSRKKGQTAYIFNYRMKYHSYELSELENPALVLIKDRGKLLFQLQ